MFNLAGSEKYEDGTMEKTPEALVDLGHQVVLSLWLLRPVAVSLEYLRGRALMPWASFRICYYLPDFFHTTPACYRQAFFSFWFQRRSRRYRAAA